MKGLAKCQGIKTIHFFNRVFLYVNFEGLIGSCKFAFVCLFVYFFFFCIFVCIFCIFVFFFWTFRVRKFFCNHLETRFSFELSILFIPSTVLPLTKITCLGHAEDVRTVQSLSFMVNSHRSHEDAQTNQPLIGQGQNARFPKVVHSGTLEQKLHLPRFGKVLPTMQYIWVESDDILYLKSVFFFFFLFFSETHSVHFMAKLS